ncbi:probable cytochrome P450 6t3 [Scaptodrosophila lebanonensis]|uniref:Probable cytochrome P450 6t3 n=1 Tax=Drosophila lebanonensis TaxID=7225 RepID=A0A6J2TTS8_DROLE|nr:probable cytochrome P450 6t3 [Scaptodrosophila lebanonensis]
MIFLCVPITLLTLNIFAGYIWLCHRYRYFKRHNISYLPASTPFGNLKELILLRISFGELFANIYAHPSIVGANVVGFFLFHTPALVIREPKIIRLILIKHFKSFLNRYEAADDFNDELGSLTLPLAKYSKWRESRQSMSQLFTTGRIKHVMYPRMLGVVAELENYLERQLGKQDSKVIKLSEMCTLFTTDMTGSLFYGLEANGLLVGKCELREQTRRLLVPNFRKLLHFMIIFFLPQYTRLIRAKLFSKEYTHFMRDLVGTALKLCRDTKDANCKPNLIDQLLQLQRSKPPTHYVQHPDFITSQASIILLAGFETSSSLLGFALYEVAKQPQLQIHLRNELHNAFATRSSLDYSTLITLPFLNMICLEALRLYPIAAFINRELTPGDSDTKYSLQPYADFVVPKGMPAYISILGLQRDTKYWPNPLCFNPERFAPENIKNIVPMTYLPFGAGPHGCIGSRLGILQLKLGLAHILKRNRVEVCEHTIESIHFSPKAFMLEAKDNIFLRIFKDEKVKL